MLGIFNISKILLGELSKHFDIIDLNDIIDAPEIPPNIDLDALFIGWVPRYKFVDKDKAGYLLKQTNIIEKYTKKKLPIIIFDEKMSMNRKEVLWLRKYGVKLFEPALNFRKEFKYLPFPLKLKKLEEIPFNVSPRNHPLAWKGNLTDKIKTFEKYYVSYAKLYPGDFNILYDSEIEKFKKEEYDNLNIEYRKEIDLQDVKCTLIIGSKREYRIGYINPFFIEALENNIIPLIAKENRYFNGISPLVQCTNEISYYTDNYEATYIGYIFDIYESIRRFYPEFDVNYSIDVIKEELS
jgi:hypothetical protein